jgi:hypothetical protein
MIFHYSSCFTSELHQRRSKRDYALRYAATRKVDLVHLTSNFLISLRIRFVYDVLSVVLHVQKWIDDATANAYTFSPQKTKTISAAALDASLKIANGFSHCSHNASL